MLLCGCVNGMKKETEAVVQRCSVKTVFLKSSQNSQEIMTLAQVFSCEFCEVFKNTYFYRTHLVAASEVNVLLISTGKVSTCKINMNQVFN